MIFKRQTIPALTLAFAMMPMAQAATFMVTTTIDEVDANLGDGICQTLNGDCTLRAAVQEANAWGGADVITLPEGLYVLALENPDVNSSADEQLSAWGDLNIRDALTINGAGADIVAIDAMAKHRVIEVLPNISFMEVSLSGLTIRNGNGGSSNGNGGGITTASNTSAVLRLSDCNVDGNTAAAGGGIHLEWGHYLIMDRCVVSGNSSLSHGAGINNAQGTMVINNSVIRDNSHAGFSNPFGGGIYNSSSSYGVNLAIAGIDRAGLTIKNTTISGNSAFIDGGGLYHVAGPLHIENSTISGNTAEKWGGGIFMATGNFGPAANRFYHVTITDNISMGVVSRVSENPPPLDLRGGGIYTRGKIDLFNSIVAHNGSGMNCYIDTSNYSNPGRVNKIGDIISDDSCLNIGETAPTVVPTIALTALANNGGATETHALLSYSGAIDFVSPYSCLSLDQRGYARDANCDVGSYEYDAVAPIDELLPTPAYAGPSAVRDNVAPIAFGMPLAVNLGSSVSAVASAADADGDPLTYEITQQPVYGSVGWDSLPPGRFTYTADPDLNGALKADSFSFRACDGIACSAPATITLFIGDAVVAGNIAISLTTSGVLGELTVIAEADVEALVADVDYTAPLGAFFFGVSDIPVDGGQNTVTVVIELPFDAVIESYAVVRKLDNNDIWQTLAASGDGSVSTAVINTVDKTITLVLVDNDNFDRDPTVGVIYDPLALSVPVNPPVVDDPPADDDAGSNEEALGGNGLGVQIPIVDIPAVTPANNGRELPENPVNGQAHANANLKDSGSLADDEDGGAASTGVFSLIFLLLWLVWRPRKFKLI